MKRFSAREFAFLSAPILVIALMGFWATRRPASDNIIEVEVAKRVTPTPDFVARGARVAAHVKLNEQPDDNSMTTWKTKLRVRAGEHLLWDDVKGTRQHNIFVGTRSMSGAWYEWNGAFKLDEVPSEWGEVALEWNADLTHRRRSWGLWRTEKSARTGRIVLRRAGEILPAPIVSTDPHFALVKSQIVRLTKPAGSTTHQLQLLFERDTQSATRKPEVEEISVEYKVYYSKDRWLLSSSDGEDWIFHSNRKSRRYARVNIDLDNTMRRPNLELSWTAHQGTYWPLHGSVRLTDGKSQMLNVIREKDVKLFEKEP